MKKIVSILALLMGAFAFFASCSDDPDSHTIGVRSVTSNSNLVSYYADQTHDSVNVVSTDSWVANTNCDWINFKQTARPTINYHINYVYGQALTKSECIVINPNTTGQDRTTAITVEANNRTVALQVKQLGNLNITKPARNMTGGTDLFVTKLQRGAGAVKIAFTVYNDAILTTENSWLHVLDNDFAGTRFGQQFEATINYDANATGAERRGAVKLVSVTGATTEIAVVQAK